MKFTETKTDGISAAEISAQTKIIAPEAKGIQFKVRDPNTGKLCDSEADFEKPIVQPDQTDSKKENN